MSKYQIIEGEYGYKLSVKDAKLTKKNFSGRPDNNGNTDRTVCLIIDDEDTYHTLAADEWSFFTTVKAGEDDNGNAIWAEPFEEVDGKVAYPRTRLKLAWVDRYGNPKKYPPRVFMHTPKNRDGVQMTDETIGELDYSYILKANVEVGPNHWSKGTNHGTTGWINVLRVMIDNNPMSFDDDDFDDEVGDIDDIADEVPFS